MDYDLSRLSTRSFEQLVQALAAEILGPATVIFGDGPDGGREATFEGPVPYPSPDDQWNGYTVVQAKFRQRPESSSDSEWALAQLKRELQEFESGTRRRPDNYLFVTNVTLSGVADAGGKDRLTAVLAANESWKLSRHDIWDYDRLRVFLDLYTNVRQAYAAWVTPGDVLALVMEQLALASPDLTNVLTTFLQKELISDQYVNLEQAGHTTEESIPISRVFIDLPVAGTPPPEAGFVTSAPDSDDKKIVSLLAGAATHKLQSASSTTSQESPQVQSRNNEPTPGRFVVVGGPGQGKSTVGQFLCQIFRAALLLGRPAASLSPETAGALAALQSYCDAEDIALPGVRRFPLRIELSDYAAALANPERPSTLLTYILSRITARAGAEVTANAFRRWLGEYPWLLVLDGLDEVPSSSNRDEVLKTVADFWVDVAQAHADVLVVATTRPQGYNDDFSPRFYRHVWLTELPVDLAVEYGRRLAKVRYGGNPERQEKVLSRLERAAKISTTARLMQTPLQVTIMTALVDRMGQPPQERWALFKEYYNVIYLREAERNNPAAELLREYRPDIDAIHHRVGLTLQVQAELRAHNEARMARSDFEDIVLDRLTEEGHAGERIHALKKGIVDAAANRLVFLVGVEADRVGFEVRSLQEFMAAEELMEGSDAQVSERLGAIASIASWRNVFLFAAGKCFSARQPLRDTLFRLCAELNDSDIPSAHATLAGSRLALDLLEDGPARNQPKYARLLVNVALEALALPPDPAHFRIANAFHPDFRREFEERATRALASKIFAERLGAFHVLAYLAQQDVSWATELVLNGWPSAVADERDLLLSLPDGVLGSLLWDRLLEATPRHSVSALAGSALARQLHLAEGAPAWAAAFRAQRRSTDDGAIRVAPEGLEPGSFMLSVWSVRGSADDQAQGAFDLPADSDPSWLVESAAQQFRADPSAAGLHDALHMIAAGVSPSVWRQQGSVAPWPLAACLMASESRDELVALADDAAVGALGEANTWSVAEERWRSRGVTTNDFAPGAKPDLPFDRVIHVRGFPADVSGWTVNHDGIADARATVIKWWQGATERTRRTLAGWLVSLSGIEEVVADGNERTEPPSLEQVAMWAKEGAGTPPWFAFGALSALPHHGSRETRWDALDVIGRRTRPMREDFSTSWTTLAATCAEALQAGPLRVGLMEIMIVALQQRAAPELATKVPRATSADSLSVQVLSAELALYGVLDRDLGEWAVGVIAEGADSDPDIVSRVVAASGDAAELERIFASLLGALNANLWAAKRDLLAALQDILDRRTSPLGTPAGWDELNLPIPENLKARLVAPRYEQL
ncbi:MAG: hypothetical protein QOJ97_2688 [Solirubrobacteraceae bacterium]|nr:hypothetical protein [Solirubrobacteraceae bacterium]